MPSKKTLSEQTLTRLSEIKELKAKAPAVRLAEPVEKEAIELLKECLLAGKAGFAPALDAMLVLPWSVGVDATTSAWPDLKPASRKALLTDLDAREGESAGRFRMSLGRGLAQTDAATSEKIIVEAAQTIASNPEASLRDRQTFANVFIGKGRPWLQSLPVTEWKKAGIVFAAIARSSVLTAPFTQLAVIEWLAAAGQIASLPAPLLQEVCGAAKRWPGKIKRELREKNLQLPAELSELLTAEPEKPAPQQSPRKKDRPDRPAQAERPERTQPAEGQERPERPERPEKTERPERPQQSQKAESHPFDITRTLRQLEQEFHKLRGELQLARAQARPREPRPEKPVRSAAPAVPQSEWEALQRHNTQLESTIGDLRQQLEEISADHEDRAFISQEHHDALTQFKVFLGTKLAEEFAAFETLRSESMSDVVRASYRDVLEQVFNVLQSEGVKFSPLPN